MAVRTIPAQHLGPATRQDVMLPDILRGVRSGVIQSDLDHVFDSFLLKTGPGQAIHVRRHYSTS